MKTKPFHQPEGDYCKDCPHKSTLSSGLFPTCTSFHKQLDRACDLAHKGWPMRLDDCKAEDE